MQKPSTQSLNESRKKSLLKACSWRFIATIITVIAAYIFTREVHVALEIGALEVIAKIFVYYLHERVWARVP